MKKYLVIVALLTFIGMSSMSNVVQAESVTSKTMDPPTKEVAKDCSQQGDSDIYMELEGMLKEVGLSDIQSKDIAGIVQAEKARVSAIQKNVEENYNELMRAAFTSQFNQSIYSSFIEKLSGLCRQIVIEHGQMMRDISAKLTNEQREKILKLIPNMKRPHRKSGFGFGFGNFGFHF